MKADNLLVDTASGGGGMIIVTGAAGVLGQAVVGKLVARRYAVAAVDFTAHVPAGGQSCSFGGVDLADDASCGALFRAMGDHGVIPTGLVNIAGGFRWETVAEGAWDSWEYLYRLNVRTAYNTTRHALPFLRNSGGTIVNIGAAATARSGPGMAAYTASKSGVARLTESVAAEEMVHAVRANAVLPGIIDTPQNRHDMPDADFSRWATPGEVAEVVAFLLSPEASGISGALIPVAGRLL